MAKLIVTRSRQYFGRSRGYRILINGRTATSIGAGGKVEIPLPPGRHEIRAKLDFVGSQPVWIDAGPEGRHLLRVGSNLRGPLRIIPHWPVLVMIVGFSLTWAGEHYLGLDLVLRWRSLIDPIFITSLFLAPALMVVWRDHCLYLIEIPRHDLTLAQIVEFEQAQPLRVRITIRQSMIAMAILAIFIWVAIQWTHHERSSYFRNRADHHADSEVKFRDDEQDFLRRAAEWTKAGLDTSPARQSAARSAARADYHAAMKRKYEEAAARRTLSLEPDPPEPPWP